MSWTSERVELLKVLWAEGRSASSIAKELGEGITRNAVIGKVHRLKFANRDAKADAAPAIPTAVKTKEQAPLEPVVEPQVIAQEVVVEEETTNIADTVEIKPLNKEILPLPDDEKSYAPSMRKLTLLQLTESTCKWPIGDPLNEDFFFCGGDVKENGPYCSHHSSIAFQIVNEREIAG